MSYVVIRREETVLCSDTNTKLPKMDLKQDVKVLSSYDEAVAYFKQAILLSPKYEWDEDNAADETLNITYQLLNSIQNDDGYVINNEDIVSCEVGDVDKDKQYCLVNSEIIKLTDIKFSSSRYLVTNIHNLSNTQNGFYIFRQTGENIFSGEVEITTFTLTITPTEG